MMITSRIGQRHQKLLLAALSVFVLGAGQSCAVGVAATNAAMSPANVKALSARGEVKPASDGRSCLPVTGTGLRGGFFNPQVKPGESPEFP